MLPRRDFLMLAVAACSRVAAGAVPTPPSLPPVPTSGGLEVIDGKLFRLVPRSYSRIGWWDQRPGDWVLLMTHGPELKDLRITVSHVLGNPYWLLSSVAADPVAAVVCDAAHEVALVPSDGSAISAVPRELRHSVMQAALSATLEGLLDTVRAAAGREEAASHFVQARSDPHARSRC